VLLASRRFCLSADVMNVVGRGIDGGVGAIPGSTELWRRWLDAAAERIGSDGLSGYAAIHESSCTSRTCSASRRRPG
jgi:hypothetical protein